MFDQASQEMTDRRTVIMLAAFDKTHQGDLYPAFEPREFDTEERAVEEAKLIAVNHAGVVAWSRDVNPATGKFGPYAILYQIGEIPQL
jgi:hypothetical protein